jgi:hypothetical protein
MDGVSRPDSASAIWQARLSEARAADSAPWAPAIANDAGEEPFATVLRSADPLDPADAATDQERMLHFMSHVDAECFISLLQVTDPVPDDWQARAQYKRFYGQLRETLTIPLAGEPGSTIPR